MKLATRKSGARDGELVVVSRDLTRCVTVPEIARTPGRPAAVGGVGYSCIAEQRTIETILAGKAATPFMRFGDRVRIEMHDAGGRSVFGAIDQTVRPPA